MVELSLEILGFLLAFLNLVTGSGLEILLWELLAGSHSKKIYDFTSATKVFLHTAHMWTI